MPPHEAVGGKTRVRHEVTVVVEKPQGVTGHAELPARHGEELRANAVGHKEKGVFLHFVVPEGQLERLRDLERREVEDVSH